MMKEINSVLYDININNENIENPISRNELRKEIDTELRNKLEKSIKEEKSIIIYKILMKCKLMLKELMNEKKYSNNNSAKSTLISTKINKLTTDDLMYIYIYLFINSSIMKTMKLLKEQCEKYESTLKDMNSAIERLLSDKKELEDKVNLYKNEIYKRDKEINEKNNKISLLQSYVEPDDSIF